MKKITTIVLSFFLGLIIISSCKKDYSCRCTASDGAVSVDTTWSLGKVSKKDAKSECAEFEDTYKALAALAGVTLSCDIEKK